MVGDGPPSPDGTAAIVGGGDYRLWEHHARWWQDEFTDGVDPEYTEQILPLIEAGLAGYRRVLDIGTGEGQVARHLSARGHWVVGLDPVRAQITEAAARGADGAVPYLLARADAVPTASGRFDAAVACLVFEHIDAVDEAIAEVARCLRVGGRFLFLLNHPLLQTPGSGWIDDQILDPPEQYWRVGPYLRETSTIEEVQKGVFIRFVHRPLSRYVNALAVHGLLVERMDEPAPPRGFLNQDQLYEQAHTIPRLLALHCSKVESGPGVDGPRADEADGTGVDEGVENDDGENQPRSPRRGPRSDTMEP